MLRGEPDRASIEQTVQDHTDPVLATAIVRMSSAFERLFKLLVEEQLADDPKLRHEVLRRTAMVFARFRLSMSAAQLDRIIHGISPDPADPT